MKKLLRWLCIKILKISVDNVTVLHIQDEDGLLFYVDKSLNVVQCQRLQEMLIKAFPQQKIYLVPDSIKLKHIIKKGKAYNV